MCHGDFHYRRETTTERSEQMHKKCIRDKKNETTARHPKNTRRLQRCKIPGIKSAKKKVLITKMKNVKGEITTSRKGIVDVFGEFNKKLYNDNEQDESEQEIGENDNESSTYVHNNGTDEMTRIPEITTEEVQTAINKLKKGKSPDSNGIRAEDVKARDEETREMVRQIFNETIKQNEFTPEDWKKVKIKVIHKKRHVENVSNYRPICSLPALYKLFSTILYRRSYPRLDQEQAEDQAGFRSSYRPTDHLATYRMIEQECHEWGIKMWTATIDFTKAFDSIAHKSILKALKSFGIKHDYISSPKKIYRDQKASVQTDEERNMFEITKGIKQGNFLFCLLFNTVLLNSLKDDIQRWQNTNLRFADDVLLFASLKEQLQKMLCEFKKSEKVGSQGPPRKDENSQQPKQPKLGHKKRNGSQ